jgi:ABC-2 type transport system permease protein
MAAGKMPAIGALIGKDLRLLTRDRGALFLTFAWPLLLAIFFGALGGFGGTETGGDASKTTAMTVLAIDEDRSEASVALLAQLDADPRVIVAAAEFDQARAQIRRGEAPAYLRIERGFGAAARPGLGGPERPVRTVEIASDPRRRSEAELLDGALEIAAWRALAREDDPARLDAPAPVLIRAAPITPDPSSPATRARASRPPSPYAVTFPQGIVWAVIACAATFAVSLVEERDRGTLLRLAVAPVPRMAILAGKAGACLVAIVGMQAVLVAVAALGFGVVPERWGLLILALAATAIGFVGLMTLLAVLGRRTRSAAGLSWAVLMSMAMLGGGMLPLFMMPSWLQTAATASPVAWALLALEGAFWRGFSLAELAPPCLALVALGGVCLAIGTRSVRSL